MNGNGSMTIGPRKCVNVSVNVDESEGGADHHVAYYSLRQSFGSQPCKRGLQMRVENLQSNPLNHIRHILPPLLPLSPHFFLLHQMLNHHQTPPCNLTSLCQSF